MVAAVDGTGTDMVVAAEAVALSSAGATLEEVMVVEMAATRDLMNINFKVQTNLI